MYGNYTKNSYLRYIGLVSMLTLGVLSIIATAHNHDPEIIMEKNCSELKLEFASTIWPIFSTLCLSCHKNTDSQFSLLSNSEFGAGDINFDRIKEYGKDLLNYAANIDNVHEGGEVINPSSGEFKSVSNFMDELAKCNDDTVIQPPN